MLPTRCVQAVLSLALALSALAFVLGGRALLAGATVLLLFPVWRGILFQQRFAGLLSSVSVMRSPATTLARQGSEIAVTTRVEWDAPLPFSCRVEDLVPPGAVVDAGETARDVPAGTEGSVTLRYRIRVLTHGEIPFGGIRLSARDPFFRNGITLSKASFTRPDLHIHPGGTFEGEGGGAGFGEKETDQYHGISALTTRSFRQYRPGDSLKAVDWKLSAKYSKLYVREYAGLLGEPPVLVIDLPDRSTAFDTPGFEQLLGSLQAAVEKAVRFYRASSLLIISGPNLVEFLPIRRDLYRWFSVQQQLIPADRRVHAFRARGDREIAARLKGFRALSADDLPVVPSGDAAAFAERLQQIQVAFAGGQAQMVFERQMRRILSDLRISDLYLFSLFAGDTSHIRRIAEIGRTYGMRVHAVVPTGSRTPFLQYTLRRSGVDEIMEAV
ncbi:MAG: DUF58 domain-containing protein [Methanomicrobiales archaeon]|nr:DUF58 domain-containing protein [Methanomicrobiales archaeon]